MRDSLFRVIKELEDHEDGPRVQAAGVLQDELREAMELVGQVRAKAAKAAVERHGIMEAARLADLEPYRMQTLSMQVKS